MEYLRDKLTKWQVSAICNLAKMKEEAAEESGAAEIVAVVVLIVIILVVAVIFRDQLKDAIGTVFDNLTTFIGEK